MNSWTKILPFVLLAACSPPTDNGQTDIIKVPPNYFNNVSRVEVFGDSLRIEYEIYDNTIIQHHIDLKGTEDDGFDNSFTITSVWSDRKPSRLDCNRKLKLTWDSLDFWFCTGDVIEYYNILLADAAEWEKEHLTKIKTDLDRIENKDIGQLETMSGFMPFKLAMTLDFQAVDLKANDTLSKMLVEKYETVFSGGKNFYIVNSDNDTSGRIHMNEYMK